MPTEANPDTCNRPLYISDSYPTGKRKTKLNPISSPPRPHQHPSPPSLSDLPRSTPESESEPSAPQVWIQASPYLPQMRFRLVSVSRQVLFAHGPLRTKRISFLPALQSRHSPSLHLRLPRPVPMYSPQVSGLAKTSSLFWMELRRGVLGRFG